MLAAVLLCCRTVPDLIRFSSLVFFYVGIMPGMRFCSNFFVILDFGVISNSTGSVIEAENSLNTFVAILPITEYNICI